MLRPTLERLEDRCTPSTLNVRSSLIVNPGAAARSWVGYADGQLVTGTGSIVFYSDAAGITVVNNTTNPLIGEDFGGHGAITSKGIGSQVITFGSDNVIQATAGRSRLVNIGDDGLILGGTGDNNAMIGKRNTSYNIVGPNSLFLDGQGTGSDRDHVFSNFAATVTGLQSTDNFAAVFGTGQGIGQFSLTYDPVHGTVNAVADNAGDLFAAYADHATLTSPVAGTLTVNYSTPPRTVFFFGGAGTDRAFDLVTTADAAMYGQGGVNNVLYVTAGGKDNVAVLKTGAGASTSYNGAGLLEYSTGSTTGQAGDKLVYANAAAEHVAFSTNPADSLVNWQTGDYLFVGSALTPSAGEAVWVDSATLGSIAAALLSGLPTAKVAA